MRTKIFTNSVRETQRLQKGGQSLNPKWLKALDLHPPNVVVRHPNPVKIEFEFDTLVKKIHDRGDYIPQIVDPSQLDVAGSADFQLASLQLNFMKRGYSEERAYTLAKLRMRNELRKKLRNLHLYERARLQKDPYDDSTRIFDVWQTQLKDTVADVKRMRPTLSNEELENLDERHIRREDARVGRHDKDRVARKVSELAAQLAAGSGSGGGARDDRAAGDSNFQYSRPSPDSESSEQK